VSAAAVPVLITEGGRVTQDLRVRAFISVGRAVQYAHSRLLIHRDLKPSNILVTAEGDVRLLDFGIAKMLGPDAGDDEGLTRDAADTPLTPERAAPEQLRGDPPTTATDVWALGVLLHELVTGVLPFPSSASSRADRADQIERAETARPSRVVLQPDAAGRPADWRAEARGTTAARLARLLRGDLDRIVAMALQSRADRRYGTAGLLADDVAAFLERRPVSARPDSWAYRARRFAQRHRVATAAAVVGLAAGIVGTGMTLAQNARVARERDRASAEANTARAVAELMAGLFRASGPIEGAGVDAVSIEALLDRGAAEVAARDLAPEVRARLWHTLASLHIDRSEIAKARGLFDRAMEASAGLPMADPDRAALVVDYGAALVTAYFERDRARDLVGPVVEALDAAPNASPALRARALAVLAQATRGTAGAAMAERSLALARSMAPPDPDILAGSLSALAELARVDLLDPARARTLWTETLAVLEKTKGADHAHTASVRANLAAIHPDAAEGVAIARRMLADRRRMFGPISKELALAWNELGVLLVQAGDLAGGEHALRAAQPVYERVLGPAHLDVLYNLWNIARITELQRRHAEALEAFEPLDRRLRTHHVLPAVAAEFEPGRARALRRVGRLAEAVAALGAARPLIADQPSLQEVLADTDVELGRLALLSGQATEAVAHLRRALATHEGLKPPRIHTRAEARAELGRALVAAGDRTGGLTLLRESLPEFARWSQAHPDDLSVLRAALARTK
jgi:serine/threonine-protein kinase